MGSPWPVPPVANLVALAAMALCACDCGRHELQGVHRDMATVSVGGAVVELSFECAGRHTGVTLAGSGRMPTGLHSPTDDWWVDFGISAQRDGARLHLADAIGSTHLVVEDDEVGAAIVARLGAESCTQEDRVAFRLVDPEGVFSMPWALAYVVGDLLLLTEGGAGDSCDEVAAAAPEVQGGLTARAEAGANRICDHLV